ncbi:hypothetical protein [Pigmentiphaga litoralis]|uniref:hypothetical protein n=1 Tax=Pigmentiphaga litoralis TaxID=516702 RepID=UPI003B436F8C
MRANTAGGRQVALRVLLAVVGGYAMASAIAIALPPVLTMPRVEAVMTATLLGYVAYVALIIVVFASTHLARLAVVMLAASFVLGGFGWTAGGLGA